MSRRGRGPRHKSSGPHREKEQVNCLVPAHPVPAHAVPLASRVGGSILGG